MKKENGRLLCILAALTVWLTACNQTPTSPEDSKGINCHVVDSEGLPIRNAGIHFIYADWDDLNRGEKPELKSALPVPGNKNPTQYQNKLYQNHPNPADLNTLIQFDVGEKSDVTLKIYDWPYYQLVRSLFSQEWTGIGGGVSYNVKDSYGNFLPNGLYPYILTVGNLQYLKYLCVQHTSMAVLEGFQSLFTTDKNGETTIAYSCIPIGQVICITEEESPEMIGSYTIQDSIYIVLTHNNYTALKRKIGIDKGESVDLDFVMSHK